MQNSSKRIGQAMSQSRRKTKRLGNIDNRLTERWRINQPNEEEIAAVNSRFVGDLDFAVDLSTPQTIIALIQNDNRETAIRPFEKINY